MDDDENEIGPKPDAEAEPVYVLVDEDQEPEPDDDDQDDAPRAAPKRRRRRPRRSRADEERAKARRRRLRRGGGRRRSQQMSGDGGDMRISWNVRKVGPGAWEGEVSVPAGYGEAIVSRVRSSSPGEAIEQAVMGAAELCAAADECGFIDLGSIIPSVLNTATGIVSAIANRGAAGKPPMPPGGAALPGPLASLAATAAMRPGGFPYPGGPPSPYAAPYGAPAYPQPAPPPPFYGPPGKPWGYPA